MVKPKSFVGLDVGGSHIKALAFSSDGSKLAEDITPTNDDGSREWLERARIIVHHLMEGVPSPVRVGVAAPGLASPDRRHIKFMPGRLFGLEGLDWQQWLGLAEPVPVYNDAQAALLGEVWLGAAKQTKNVVLLTLGTGVGGAAMVDGHILHGHIGRAGHLGHISLDPDGALDIARTPGSLEDAIGECTLTKRSAGRFSTTRELVAAFRQGLPDATKIWLQSVRSLAAGLAGLINVLDPEVVVIGGGIADAEDALFQPLQADLDEFEWRPGGAKVRLVKAELGQNAGAAGAAYGAKIQID
jgi:glucokinase